MKQFLLFVRKEFYHVFRDRKTLLLLFGMPIVQIVLFGFALTNEIKNSKIVVCDYSKDVSTRAIIDRLDVSGNFEVAKILPSGSDIENAFREGNIKLAIVFPPDFHHDLYHSNRAQVQIIADASDPNTATTLTMYASNIIAGFQREIVQEQNIPYQVDTEIRMIYNPELKGTTNFVPGVMALVLFLISVLMTSVSIVREKESGTMEILLVSPFNPLLVVLSKAIPYFFLSLINLSVILFLSVYLLDLPIEGSVVLIFIESSLFIITSLSMGLLISTLTASQQAAMLISLVGTLLPTMMLSGFIFPLENMPRALQVIANIVPAKWFFIIAKSVMVKGLGFFAIWKESLILLGMTLIFLFVSIKKFKTRLA